MTGRILFIFLLSFAGLAAAQPPVNASPSVDPASAVTAASPGQTPAEDQGSEEEKPFVPHWTGQLALNYSTQPTQQGQGQQSKELGLTGTYDITESGHYFSVGITAGQQLVEGLNTNYGQVTGEGGLGLGFFQPSLSFAMQQGASALNSYTATLNLNFQLLDSLTVGPTGNLGLESHQGPASQIYPGATNPDTVLQVDTGDWTGGLAVSYLPTDFLTFSLTGDQEIDYTYDTHGVNGDNQKSVNQSDRIDSLTLEGEVTFLKDFQIQLSAEVGEEYYSAGTVYSPITGKTQTFSKPTQDSFTAYTMGLVYNFQ